MSRKALLITVVTLVLLAAGLYAYMVWKKQPVPAGAPGDSPITSSGSVTPPQPSGEPADGAGTNTFPISVQDGASSLSVKDFRGTSQRLPGEVNNYVLTDTPTYHIEYAGSDDSFSIMLQGNPIADARAAAEKYFLEQLGLTEQNACKLKVTLMVPYWVNALAAGRNYGLSFCPGAAALPTQGY